MPASNFKANGYTIGPAADTTLESGRVSEAIYEGRGVGPNIDFASDDYYPDAGDAVLAGAKGSDWGTGNGFGTPGRAVMRSYDGNLQDTQADLFWEPLLRKLHSPGRFGVSWGSPDGTTVGGLSFPVTGPGVAIPFQVWYPVTVTADNFNVAPAHYATNFLLTASAVRTVSYLKNQLSIAGGTDSTLAQCAVVQILIGGANAITFKHNQGSIPSGSKNFLCDGDADIVANPGDLLFAYQVASVAFSSWRLKKF